MINFANKTNLVSRSTPFDYYTIKSTKPDNNGIFQRAAHTAQESFKNLAYYFCNGLIACANTLRLYKLQKVEKKSFLPTTLEKVSFICASAAVATPFPLTLVPQIILEFVNLKQFLNIIESKKLAIAGWLFRAIPVFGLGYQAVETYHIAKKSLDNLKLCWNDTKKPLKSRVVSAIVHGGNLAQTVSLLYRQVVYNHLCFNLFSTFLDQANTNNAFVSKEFEEAARPYKKKVDQAFEKYDRTSGTSKAKAESEIFEASEDFQDFQGLYFGKSPGDYITQIERCQKVSDVIPSNATDKDRILKLNPNCTAHAFEMVAPGKDPWKDSSGIKKGYKVLMQAFHCDKYKEDDCKELSANIGTATNTINRVWKRQPQYGHFAFPENK